MPRRSTAFLLTTLIVVATPGTGVLYTLAAGLAHGARASVVAVFGCTLGVVPHMVAAITGLAALLHASALAFQVLKYLGVAYLLLMAWSTLRDHSALTVQERASLLGELEPDVDAAAHEQDGLFTLDQPAHVGAHALPAGARGDDGAGLRCGGVRLRPGDDRRAAVDGRGVGKLEHRQLLLTAHRLELGALSRGEQAHRLVLGEHDPVVVHARLRERVLGAAAGMKARPALIDVAYVKRRPVRHPGLLRWVDP